MPVEGKGRALALALALGALIPSSAAATSLYDGPGPRPGPDVLYEPPASAPQLENTGVWEAEPILVSGASAYRDGEFLYQDFLYDDHGARGLIDPARLRRLESDLFSLPNGSYTYPTAPAYAGNAADLVELRVKPLAGATAFRLTLNSMVDPELVAATIAIGDSPHPRPLPHGANVRARARLFLTVHGQEAELLDARTGRRAGTPVTSVDVARRQIELRVPHSDWDPGEGRVRLSAGVGLWDRRAGRYLVPRLSADGSHPGGGGLAPAPAAIFNAAFRFREPLPNTTDLVHNVRPAWWRDRAQGEALAAGDLGRFRVQVDFAKLAAGVDDERGVPRAGPMDRILASRFEPHQGVDHGRACGEPARCDGILGGRLQPYAIYVPRRPAPPGGYGLTLLLHSLSASYNQFLGSRNQSQFGGRGGGSIVITPSGRGPDGWYYDLAGADTFEVWADVAARYPLHPDRTAIAGYSMGGYGTYKLAAQYPDLFARAQPTVGPPATGASAAERRSDTIPMLASLRHVPLLAWNGALDELVPLSGALAQASELDRLGYRYELDVFTADHFLLAVADQYAPAARFLGDARVVRDPTHVSYVVNPTMDFERAGTVADHAYWLSGLELRSPGGAAPRGTIDAVSHGLGSGDPPARPTGRGIGLLTGGTLPLAYTRQFRTWGPARARPAANRLELRVRNLARVTVHPGRAGIGCDAALDVRTDGPVTVTLAGCGRSDSFGV